MSREKDVINLANATIGVSLLAVPLVIQQCGIALGSTLILLAWYLMKESCSLLIHASHALHLFSIEEIAFETFGTFGKIAAIVSAAGLQVGATIASHSIIGDIFLNLFSGFFPAYADRLMLRGVAVILCALCIVSPICLSQNVSTIANMSIGAMGVYVVLTLYLAFLAVFELMTTISWTQYLVFWRVEGASSSLNILSLAFSCQGAVFVVSSNMAPLYLSNLVSSSLNVCLYLFFAVGTLGYLALGISPIDGNVLNNFPPGVFSSLTQLAFLVGLVLSFPVVVHQLRSLYVSWADSNTAKGREGNLMLVTFGIVLSTSLIALVIPKMEITLTFIGATAGGIITYLLPGAIYIKLKRSRGSLFSGKRGWLVLLCGFVVIYMGLNKVFSPSALTPVLLDHKVVPQLPLLEMPLALPPPAPILVVSSNTSEPTGLEDAVKLEAILVYVHSRNRDDLDTIWSASQ